jgi:hypothetical protein
LIHPPQGLAPVIQRALSEPTSERQLAAALVVTVAILPLSSRNRFVSKTKILVILVPGSMVGVGIQNQLGVRHVLNQIERIHRVDVVVAAHDHIGC